MFAALPFCANAQLLPDAGYEARSIGARALSRPYYTSAFGGEFQIEAPGSTFSGKEDQEFFFHLKRLFFSVDQLDHAPFPIAAVVPRRAPYDAAIPLEKSAFVYELAVKDVAGVPVSGRPAHPFTLIFPWPSDSYVKKGVYWWDGNAVAWKPLPSTSDFDLRLVSAPYQMPYGQFAVFEDPEVFEGWASWYRFRGGNFAALKEYAQGDRYQVTNITPNSPRFGKSIQVVINDYGPQAITGRAIDLDVVAFRAIANPRNGIGLVQVRRLR